MEEMKLTGGLIKLKPFVLEDAEAHLAGEDEAQQKWLSGGKSNLESVRTWIEKNEKFWKNDGPVFNFAVWVDNELVGMVEANSDCKKVEGLEPGDANISYGIYPAARGKGYAIKAVNILTDFLKQKGFNGAVIRIEPENKQSLKVPNACNFTYIKDIDTEGGKMMMFIKDLKL